MKKITKGYKAFNKGLVCQGFKFKVGKEYTHKGKLKLCESGFHFCLNPLDVLNYYNVAECEFAKVSAVGVSKETDNDSKRVAKMLKVDKKLTLKDYIKEAVGYLLDNIKDDNSKLASSGDYSKLASSENNSRLASSGYCSQLASSGDYSKLASSGNYSQLASSGDYSRLASSGDGSQLASSGDYSQLAMKGSDSVGANIGVGGTIKAKKGNWITLAEYDDDGKPVCVKSAQVDGKKIKADTWYKLENRKFVEVK